MKSKNQFGGGENKDIPIVPMVGIQQLNIITKSGNTLTVFYNPDNDLVVLDLVAKNELCGTELLRQTLNEKKLLSHTKV